MSKSIEMTKQVTEKEPNAAFTVRLTCTYEERLRIIHRAKELHEYRQSRKHYSHW